MQIGMIGLGRMGANMARRLMRGGHECIVYDQSVEVVQALVKEGAEGAASLDDFVARLEPPRAVWMMLPAAVVDRVIEQAGVTKTMDGGWVLGLAYTATVGTDYWKNYPSVAGNGTTKDMGAGTWIASVNRTF